VIDVEANNVAVGVQIDEQSLNDLPRFASRRPAELDIEISVSG
jgi:hypothetical protein